MSWQTTPLWAVLRSPGYPVVSALSPILVATGGGAGWSVSDPTKGSVTETTTYKVIGNTSILLTAFGNGNVSAIYAGPWDLSAKSQLIFAFYVPTASLAIADPSVVLRVLLMDGALGSHAYYDIPARRWGAGWNVLECDQTNFYVIDLFSWSYVTAILFEIRSASAQMSLAFEDVYAFTRTAAYPIAQIYVEPGGDSGWRLEAATAKNYPLGASFPVIHDLGYTNYTREWAGVIRSQHQLQNVLSCVKQLVILRGPRDAGTPAWCDGERGPSIHDIGETVPKWRKTLAFERRDAAHLA